MVTSRTIVWRRSAIAFAIVGIAALVVGIVYEASGKHGKRGAAGIIAGVVLLAIAIGFEIAARRAGPQRIS